MPGTHDVSAGQGGLEPREAARLLEQTTRKARRRFDLSSSLLSLLGAAVVLAALGAV
jgi:hypothetical protein